MLLTTTDKKYIGRAIVLVIALSLSPLAGQRAFSADEATVLTVVNGDTITTADLDSALVKTHRGLGMQAKTDFDYKKLLTKMVNDKLILQEAEALGMGEDEVTLAKLQKGRTDNARRMYVREQFQPVINIPEVEIAEYFDKMYWKMQFRTISVPEYDKAEKLIEAIKNGAPMDSLAEALSYDSRRYKGGLHNLKFWADIENIDRVQCANLKPGELTQPYKYRDVLRILRVEQRLPADSADLPRFEAKIKAVLSVDKKKQAWQDFVADLRAGNPLIIDSTILSNIAKDADKILQVDFLKGTDNPVISINDEFLVTDNELRKEISHSVMTAGNSPFEVLMDKAIESKSEGLLLVHAAARSGFLDHPQVMKQYEASHDSARIEAFLSEMVVSQIVFSRDEFEQYYNEHLDEYREPDEFQLASIYVNSREKADEVVARLKDGADFRFVARQFSTEEIDIDEEKEWVSLGIFPDSLQTALALLAVGQTSQAFQAGRNWIVFKVKGRRPGRVKTMQEVDMRIREIMFQRKFEETLDKHLQTLKDNSIIEDNTAEIEKYFGKGS